MKSNSTESSISKTWKHDFDLEDFVARRQPCQLASGWLPYQLTRLLSDSYGIRGIR